MTVYKEGGKARKQCPKCEFYSHARSLVCDCGFEFKKGSKPVKADPVVYDEPGKGRKLCKCGKYIGAKSLVCHLCGNMVFEKAVVPPKVKKIKKKKEKVIPTETFSKNYFGALIITPSGKCPEVLKTRDKDGVFQWCEEVFLNGLRHNKTYTREALRYWFSQLETDKTLKDHIDEWCSTKGYEKNTVENSKDEESSERESETLELSGM